MEPSSRGSETGKMLCDPEVVKNDGGGNAPPLPLPSMAVAESTTNQPNLDSEKMTKNIGLLHEIEPPKPDILTIPIEFQKVSAKEMTKNIGLLPEIGPPKPGVLTVPIESQKVPAKLPAKSPAANANTSDGDDGPPPVLHEAISPAGNNDRDAMTLPIHNEAGARAGHDNMESNSLSKRAVEDKEPEPEDASVASSSPPSPAVPPTFFPVEAYLVEEQTVQHAAAPVYEVIATAAEVEDPRILEARIHAQIREELQVHEERTRQARRPPWWQQRKGFLVCVGFLAVAGALTAVFVLVSVGDQGAESTLRPEGDEEGGDDGDEETGLLFPHQSGMKELFKNNSIATASPSTSAVLVGDGPDKPKLPSMSPTIVLLQPQDGESGSDSETEKPSLTAILNQGPTSDAPTQKQSNELFARYEAESFQEGYGIQVDSLFHGSTQKNIGSFDNNYYMVYANVTFGPPGTTNNIIIRYSKQWNGGTLEARFGGPDGIVIGTFEPPVTGGWGEYEVGDFAIKADGVHSLTLISNTDGLEFGTGLMNIDWFELASNDLFARYEAESFQEGYGIQVDDIVIGTDQKIIGSFDNNHYMVYANVTFGPPGTTGNIIIRYSKQWNGGTLEARLGGPDGIVVGTFEPPVTGGWGEYEVGDFAIKADGVHSLTLVANTDGLEFGTGLMNIDWFELAPPPSIT